MRLREIEAFHAVMQSGSMSAAAALLNVSQSAISQLLGHAESRLGFRLFERSRGKLIPTIEGRLLFVEAQHAIDAVDQVRSLARNLRSDRTDHIKIAATDPVALKILPQAVQNVRQRFPLVKVSLRVAHRKELIRELLSHEIDLGFMFEPPDHPAIIAEIIASTRFLLATHADDKLPGASPVTLSELSYDRVIHLPFDLPPANLLERISNKRQDAATAAITVQTSHLAVAMVQAGGGIALIDGLTAAALQQPGVRFLQIAPPVTIRIGALWSETREKSILMDEVCKGVTRLIAQQAEIIS